MATLSLSHLLAALLPEPLEMLLADSLDHFGKQVKPALYAYLCEKGKRAAVLQALNQGVEAAVNYLKPRLMRQFKLPAAAASAAATFIVKTLAMRGRARLCAELEQQLGPLPRLKPKPKRKSARKTARKSARKPGKRTTAKKRPAPTKRRSRAGR
ncbi:MAG: hypothetical protein RMK99_05535 [Anaerolineales bacterium]|nr:hypothetical protein [Anaerolineales bacterium]